MPYLNNAFRITGSWAILGAIFTVAVLGICLSVNTRTTKAQTVDANVCRAAIILDISDSITDEKLEVLRNQIRRLFQPAGLYSDKIEIAFWTFSNKPVANNNNYNAPFHDYVSSKGEDTGFSAELSAQRTAQGTNYQQAFAYNGNVRNPYLGSIIDRTDIMAFLSDGAPNYPTEPGKLPWPSQYALDAGRNAVLKHRAAGRAVIGGNYGNIAGYSTPWGYIPSSQSVMNYIVNGDRANSKDIFSVSPQYSDLAAKLTEHIKDGCVKKTPPVDASYALTPAASVNPTSSGRGEKATFGYVVTNSRPAVDPRVDYSTIGIKVNPGVSTTPITNYAGGYKDVASGSSPAAIGSSLITQLGGSGNASLLNGTPSGSWTRSSGIPSEEFTIPESARGGEKYCRVLVINKPTDNAAPQYRYSAAACVVVGKKPTVQIHGGDLLVGRTFADDTIGSLKSIVRTSTTTLGTKTFGSWVEYGIAAPSDIAGTASVSGLQGGSVSNLQDGWSKLSFANTPKFGHFSESATGRIPDVASALRQIYSSTATMTGAVTLNASHGGRYTATGDIRLNSYQFNKPGQTVVIYAPSNTVTIAGNMTYGTQRMTQASEIPQLVIIADRINIESSVTRVDAWLIANGTTGQIDTCSNVVALSASVCSTQLTVNGPVMSKQLILKRTSGAEGVDDAARDTPAEKFNLRADAYLWAQSIQGSERRAMTTYTAELPPRF